LGRQLLRIGYDRIAGVLEGGVEAWSEAGLPVSSFETAEIEDLATWILSAEPMTVIDTRDESEWMRLRLPGRDRSQHPRAGRLREDHPRRGAMVRLGSSPPRNGRSGVMQVILDETVRIR
jgi:rhodanese-related sulfurtransferase